jgi:hypothetical protein
MTVLDSRADSEYNFNVAYGIGPASDRHDSAGGAKRVRSMVLENR